MKIIIHRGQHQIGGSIVEISTQKIKLIFDIGINLNEGSNITVPEINGLFTTHGREYDAIFLSHYHSDHIGLWPYIKKDIPLYLGKKAFDIVKSSTDYRKIPMDLTPCFFEDGIPVIIGDIKVTPYRCDHSAYDAYMFLIEADGRKVLYTGDYRANGRQNFNLLLGELPEVDVLITEGTTLSRDITPPNIDEILLEDIAVRALNTHTGPAFIMMSAMNIDRLKTVYNAALKTGRIFLEDLYTAEIAKYVPEISHNNTRVFITDGKDEHHKKLEEYGNLKISKYEIIKHKYIMCVRQSMKNYLGKLSELQSFNDGILFYGMWKGYQEDEKMKEFLAFMEGLGVKIHTLHTSGHADVYTIEKLINDVKPKYIMPLHTENEKWFNKYEDVAEVIYQESELELYK